MKEATARIKINKLLETAGWRFFADDPRVNKNESDQMVEGLKKRGIEVEYMVKANEGHGFHNEENRYDFYGAMESFFTKHLAVR